MKFTTIVVSLIFASVLVIWLFGQQSAAPDDIQALSQMAKPSAAATAIVQKALKTNPTPTVGKLAGIKKEVNKQLALETSRVITGDLSLQSPASIQANADEPMPLLLRIAMGVVAAAILIAAAMFILRNQ